MSERSEAFASEIAGARDADELGALEGQSTAPLEPRAALRERLLSSAARSYEGFVERLAALFDLDAARIRELLAELPGDDGWASTPITGLELFHLQGGPRTEGADCGFVRLQAEHAFPHHAHEGEEWALVLGGRSEDSGGPDAFPGDVVHFEPGTEHTFRSVGPEPLLFAVVNYGIRFDVPEPDAPA